MDNQPDNLWDGKSRGGHFGYQFFVSVIRLLGISSAYCFLAFVVIYFIPFAPKATKSIWKYYRNIIGTGRLRSCINLYLHYYVFGQTLIDKTAMRVGLAGRFKYKFDNYPRFLDILNSGNGVIMIGAHIGCWEAGSTFFGEYGEKINIVMLDAEHQEIKKVLDGNSRQHDGHKTIPVGTDGLELMLRIKSALNKGEYICFNGDRYTDIKHTAKMSFCKHSAYFPTGPFLTAVRCQVPVIFYYAVREKNRTYRFIFEEADTDSVHNADRLLARYVGSIEKILEQYPHQWFNFYDFWNLMNTDTI